VQAEVQPGLFKLDFAGAIVDLVALGTESARTHAGEVDRLISSKVGSAGR